MAVFGAVSSWLSIDRASVGMPAHQPERRCLDQALSDSLGWTQRTCTQGRSDCTLTPLGQGGGAAVCETVAASELAWVVAIGVDRGLDGGACVCRVLMALTRAMAPARRRKGCCECSARVLRQRLVSWPPSWPITVIAARDDGRLSVTIDAGRPSRVIARVRHSRAALRSRRFVTTPATPSPS